MNRIIAVIFCLLALSACGEKKVETAEPKQIDRSTMTDKQKHEADIEHLKRRSRVADRFGEKQANESQVFDKLGIKQGQMSDQKIRDAVNNRPKFKQDDRELREKLGIKE